MKINKVSQISSKKGDSGISKNYNSDTFKKNDILFEVLGTIDELSSFLGLVYHFVNFEKIKIIQKKLEYINAKIATSPESELYKKLECIKDEDINWLETEMQKMLDQKPIEAKFYLPGSEKTKDGAFFDYARTIARKVERTMVNFIEKTQRVDIILEVKYINRLSDYLFVLSNFI